MALSPFYTLDSFALVCISSFAMDDVYKLHLCGDKRLSQILASSPIHVASGKNSKLTLLAKTRVTTLVLWLEDQKTSTRLPFNTLCQLKNLTRLELYCVTEKKADGWPGKSQSLCNLEPLPNLKQLIVIKVSYTVKRIALSLAPSALLKLKIELHQMYLELLPLVSLVKLKLRWRTTPIPQDDQALFCAWLRILPLETLDITNYEFDTFENGGPFRPHSDDNQMNESVNRISQVIACHGRQHIHSSKYDALERHLDRLYIRNKNGSYRGRHPLADLSSLVLCVTPWKCMNVANNTQSNPHIKLEFGGFVSQEEGGYTAFPCLANLQTLHIDVIRAEIPSNLLHPLGKSLRELSIVNQYQSADASGHHDVIIGPQLEGLVVLESLVLLTGSHTRFEYNAALTLPQMVKLEVFVGHFEITNPHCSKLKDLRYNAYNQIDTERLEEAITKLPHLPQTKAIVK